MSWDGKQNLYINRVSAAQKCLQRALRRSGCGNAGRLCVHVHALRRDGSPDGQMVFYYNAVTVADAVIARFYDRTAGAFYDAALPEGGAAPLGALSARRKPLQDSPTPAGNPTAASALLRLELLTGREDFRHVAKTLWRVFRELWALWPVCGQLWAGAGAIAAGPMQVVVVGSGRKPGGWRRSRWPATRSTRR